MKRLNIYKTHPNVVLPKFSTKQSACFDLSFQAEGKSTYNGYNSTNAPFSRSLSNGSIKLMPGDRILVPTGLIFDIPQGYSLRIHPRSGLSYKQGLVLANLEAVIDSDYIQETMVILTNTSNVDQTIFHGDRIAQAEMIKSEEYVLWEIFDAPTQKTDRVGGLGSTGVTTITQPRKNPLMHHAVLGGKMPGAHRNGDSRFCGAKTIVQGQSTVLVNGILWAVEGDIDTHCNQGALKAVYGAKNVKIEGKLVICAMGDIAAPDKAGCEVKHPTGPTNPKGRSGDVVVYSGGAGGGR